jgi:hypothetical protein
MRKRLDQDSSSQGSSKTSSKGGVVLSSSEKDFYNSRVTPKERVPIELDDSTALEYRHFDHLHEKHADKDAIAKEYVDKKRVSHIPETTYDEIRLNGLPDAHDIPLVYYDKGVRRVIGKADIVDGVVSAQVDKDASGYLEFSEIRDVSIGFNFRGPKYQDLPYRSVPSRTLFNMDMPSMSKSFGEPVNLTDYQPPASKFPRLNRNDIPL